MQPNETSSAKSDRVIKSALSMAFGTMTSRVLGLVRDMAFAAMFNRTITDAWGVAFRLPNMFRRLLGEGSLSVSFIPVFVEARVADPQGARAHNLVNSFYTVLLLVLGVLTALGIIFAEPVVRLLVDDNFNEVVGKFELTVRMAQIMFCFIFLMSTYAFFMGILNALGKFALPAMAPTLFNVAMIIANFVPKSWQTVEGDALAYGVVVGGFLQTGILIPSLMRLGYFPKLSSAWKNPDVARVWRNMLPGMLGMGLLQITTIINTNFASSLGEGSNTYIYLADRLLELPLSLVSVSLGTALLPTLSRLWAEKSGAKMIETTNYYLRLNLFVAVPAAIGLYMLAVPIVTLLFGRGKFGPEDIAFTASVVQVYSLTLLASSSVRVLVPSFYAIKNTWFPAVVSGVCLLLHVLMAPSLMQWKGIEGLVFSTFLSAAFNFIFLLIGFHYLIGSFGLGKFLVRVLKFLLPGLALVGFLSVYPKFYEILESFMGSSAGLLISLIVMISFSAVIYAGFAYLCKIEEFHGVWNSFVTKIKRKFAK